MWKHRGPGPTPRVSDQQALLQPHPGHSLLHSRTCSRPMEDTPLPAQVFCKLFYLGPQRPLLTSLWVCFCTWESLLVHLPRVLSPTALSPASIWGIAGQSLVGLFSTCFKRLFSMEIQRPGPRWPDSGLHIKSSVALTSISSFVTCQRGPPQPQFLLLLCLT